ncbi:MAG: hypothetical protein ABUL63_01485, partial [Acidobacteriota bacterium]
ITWDELLGRLEAVDWRAAIVGPHGHGKSTLLGDLGRRLETRGLRTLRLSLREAHPRLTREERRQLRNLGPNDVLLLDGAERLDRWAWWLVRFRTRRAAGLVVTAHQPGLLATLVECCTTPQLLEGIVAELLDGSDGGDGGDIPDAAELHARHGGDVREALFELYDRWAGR